MTPVLYQKERKVLDFIVQYIQRRGYSPTLQEIADGCGLKSPATVHEHIWYLIKKGYLKKSEGVSRSIEVVKEMVTVSEPQINLPLMGYIAAGAPLEPYSEPDASFAVAATMVSGKKPAYVLQVKGESMIEEGIFDGDYVVVEHQEMANDGDIVIALLENGFATMKKYYREGERIKLMPANSTMQPIYVTSVTIQGRVVGVIRKFN
ncbi:transcriptional repressor LexA [Candidatus Gottesmanbacteria bacterium]|nr:transcriptional repressor LexA [Candidatus Gottesmanbacteria bacterium]